VTEIAQEIFDDIDAARVATLLLAEFKAFEIAASGTTRLIRGKAGLTILGFFAFEVIAQFVVEITFDGVATEQRSKPKWNEVQPAVWVHEVAPLHESSFIAQGTHGVGANGPSSRKVRSEKRDRAEQEWNEQESARVARAHIKKQMAKIAGDGKGSEYANAGTEQHKTNALAEDKAENVAALRAQSDANANFAEALGDGIGDDAVNADDSENESNNGEYAEEAQVEALMVEGTGENFGHC